MDRKQISPVSPTAKLDAAKENVLYRHRIASFIEKIAPLKSRLKDRVLKVREMFSYQLGKRNVKRFVYARA